MYSLAKTFVQVFLYYVMNFLANSIPSHLWKMYMQHMKSIPETKEIGYIE